MKKYRAPKRKYKLYSLITALTNAEERRLRKFLKSPFFVLRKDVLELFEFFVKIKSKGKPLPPLDFTHSFLFPKEEFDAVKVRGVMSNLLELLERFLVVEEKERNKLGSKLVLSKIFRNRRLNKCYLSNLKKTEDLIENQPLRTEKFYQNVLDYQTENMKYAIPNRRTSHLFFQEISETNDILYLIRKLRNACSQLTHQSVYKTEYDNGLLKYFIEDLGQSKYLDIPAVAIYYYCFKFLSEESGLAYFQKFKKILSEEKEHYTKEDLKGHYRLGINFCIRKLNEGDKHYAKEGWELYKVGLEEEILLENKQISRFTFNNTIAMALLLKEYKWVEKFVRDNESKLKEEFRHQTKMFNFARLEFARLEFARSKFGKALLYLQEAEYKDLVNNLIAKMMQAKIYYELKEYDTLESFLESFSQFIRRSEVSDYHRDNFKNNMKYLKKLISIPKYDKEIRLELINAIRLEKDLSEKNWLLMKANE